MVKKTEVLLSQSEIWYVGELPSHLYNRKRETTKKNILRSADKYNGDGIENKYLPLNDV